MDKNPRCISQEQQEEFERYLLYQMSETERLVFEEKLKTQSGLVVQFDEFKKLFETVEEAGLRSKLNDFQNELDTEDIGSGEIRPLRGRGNYLWAASIAALIALGGFWLFNRQSPGERMFEEFFVPDPGLPTVMGNNEDYSFYEAMVDYKHGDYGMAIEKWKELLTQKPENDTLNYFLGSAHLANGNYTVSIPFLKKVSATNESSFQQESQYYLGLAQLQKGNIEKARKTLRGLKSAEAKRLLKALEKL